MSDVPAIPPGLDPAISSRTITIEADARSLDGMLKEATSRQFTVRSDERQRLGGDDSAPSPLQYFVMGIGL